jgi:glycerophosphoryl diester phosphodiesterase
MKKNIPLVLAHRGIRSQFPENTLQAIQASIDAGVDGVEVDVDLTSDNVPFLIHQSTLVPNHDMTKLELGTRDESRSWSHQYSWDKIKDIDVGSWFRPHFTGARFALLQEMLSLDWGAVTACIELKNPSFYKKADRRFAERIVSMCTPLIRSFIEGGGNVQIISFDPYIFELVQSSLPAVEKVLALDCCFDPAPEESMRIAERIGANGVVVWERWIGEDARWKSISSDLGMDLWAFELSPDVNQLKEGKWSAEKLQEGWRRVYELGVKGLHTDFPAECAAYFKQLGNKSW